MLYDGEGEGSQLREIKGSKWIAPLLTATTALQTRLSDRQGPKHPQRKQEMHLCR